MTEQGVAVTIALSGTQRRLRQHLNSGPWPKGPTAHVTKDWQ